MPEVIHRFGVEVLVVELDVDRVESSLPPSPVSVPGTGRIAISARVEGSDSVVIVDGRIVHRVADREQASVLAIDEIEHAIAELSPFVFLHAGVVAVEGRAILIPGSSRSGKSTLVRALLAAGATYYSDEYAVLDRAGLVQPYARPLSLRPDEGTGPARRVFAAELGAPTGTDPIPVGAVLLSRFVPGATASTFDHLPTGPAVLAMMEHAVAARRSPKAVLDAVSAVASSAVVWQGVRADAGELARQLVARPPWA